MTQQVIGGSTYDLAYDHKHRQLPGVDRLDGDDLLSRPSVRI
jgi:hypothetical protein